MSIVELDEAKAQLGIDATDTDADALLSSYVEAIGTAVETYLDEVVTQRSVTDYVDCDGSGVIALPHRPIISLTSVTSADGTRTWDTDQFVATGGGVLRVISGRAPTGLVEFSCEAGYATVPENIKRGALVILQHNWETRRGVGSVGAGVIGVEERFDPSQLYSIPRKALEWLGARTPAVG